MQRASTHVGRTSPKLVANDPAGSKPSWSHALSAAGVIVARHADVVKAHRLPTRHIATTTTLGTLLGLPSPLHATLGSQGATHLDISGLLNNVHPNPQTSPPQMLYFLVIWAMFMNCSSKASKKTSMH